MTRGTTKLSVVAILLISPHYFAYGDSLEANLLNCRAIIIDSERLSCLDDAIAALHITELSDNESQKNEKIDPNTLTPLGEKYIHKKNSVTKNEHVFDMVKAYKNRKKHWIFELENGQRWQQNEARYLPSPSVFPVKVTISEGKFGAFNLWAEYLKKTVKVKRIQ
jgi:hypothetical protein